MSYTGAQLALRVLERLKVVIAPDSPTALDLTTVTTFYNNSLAEMRADNVAYWDQDDIPDEAFQALADLIAGRVAPDFGVTRPDLEQSGDLRLRRISAQGPTGRPVTSTFF